MTCRDPSPLCLHPQERDDHRDDEERRRGGRWDTGEEQQGVQEERDDHRDEEERRRGGRWDTGEAQRGGRWDTGEAQRGGRWDTGEAQRGGRWDTGEEQRGGARSGHRERGGGARQRDEQAFEHQQADRDRYDDRRRDRRRRLEAEAEENPPPFGSAENPDDGTPPAEKEKPNFELSGALVEDTNTFRGVVIKYNEPPEARIPKRRWRLYPFKNDEPLPVMYVHRQSAYLLGRQRKIADIPIDHPSCSKQHAVFQYRSVPLNPPYALS